MNKKLTVTSGKETLKIEEPGLYEVFLTKPGTEVEIFGAFETRGQENCEVTVVIYHQAKHTRANTTLKGVGRDQSRIVFTGRIVIEEDCGDSNSFLTERIILLSDQAKAEAIPELEILTDDVKCSHAASVSRIPEEHIFYLMSRGISREKAEEMIVEGFLK